jgi:riboflavin synthase
MFTGIIEEKGTVLSIESTADKYRLNIKAKVVLCDTRIGDSIAVNGVCMTVTDMTDESFSADIMPETLRRSSIGSLKSGSCVNLERAMAANGRFGGHIVTGHIDGTGKISSVKKESNAVLVSISAPQNILHLIVEKGSVAIDGISLTVTKVTKTDFSVSLIPHTVCETTLLSKRAGETVNLENDVLGKYVEKLMKERENKGITRSFLLENGF